MRVLIVASVMPMPALRRRELEKTQEQLQATTETAELARREDARARRLATAREVSGVSCWLVADQVLMVGGSVALCC